MKAIRVSHLNLRTKNESKMRNKVCIAAFIVPQNQFASVDGVADHARAVAGQHMRCAS